MLPRTLSEPYAKTAALVTLLEPHATVIYALLKPEFSRQGV